MKGTIFGCVSLLLFTLPPHGGFLLVLFLLFIVPLSVYSTVIMYRDKQQRKIRAIKLFIWAVSILVVVGVNYHRHINTRIAANNIVASIERYKSATGKYPDNLDQIGVTKRSLRNKLGMSGYYNENGKASLFYGVTFIVFDTYNYNFENHQ